MQWKDRPRSKRSGNFLDRRGRGSRGGSAGVPLGIGGTLILLVLSLVFGTDLFALFGVTPQATTAPPPSAAQSAAEDELAAFVEFLTGDTQDTWAAIFDASGIAYEDAGVVAFRGGSTTACGYAQSAVGPFYCPLDSNVYLDLTFFRTMRDRLGAPGDFAQAYVIAHEIGHHVQNQLGTLGEVRTAQQAAPGDANELSVLLELQADCYAGVWGASARDLLEPGDLEEGLRAAASVGDDVLSGGRAHPESFTHGSAEQRQRWFRTGFETADPYRCDTFAAAGF